MENKNEKELDIAKNIEQEINLGKFDVDEHVYVKKETFLYKLKKSNFYTKIVKKSWIILLPYFITTAFLIVLPLVAIILFSLIKPTGNNLVFKLSFSRFIILFSQGSIWISLGLSLLYAFIASIFCVIVAYPIAYIMASIKNKFLVKNMWVIVTLPMWISAILKIIGLQSLFYILAPTALGMPIAIIIGMIYLFLPFAITPIYNSLENRDLNIENAARDLGAKKTKVFVQHTLRSSIPGLISAFTLVIIQAATSLLVVKYMGVGKINLITSVIESYFFMGTDFGYGAAVSVILAIFVFAIIVLSKILADRFETKRRGNFKRWKK